MNRIKRESTEKLGCIGGFIWSLVYFMRDMNLSDNEVVKFLLGVLPNLGAAWAFTMLGKWIILYTIKKSMTLKIHFVLCASVLVFAVASEIIHDKLLNSPFDIWDIILTIIAQLVIAFLPFWTKDACFKELNEKEES